MKAYTYPHKGSMAMYKEPKCTDTNCNSGMSVTAFGDYMGKCPHCNDWTKSRIGYIKEPEFKDGEEVYFIGTKSKCIYLEDHYGKEYAEQNYSHYYEGQEIDENEIEYEK